jgi:hypothetical protein
MEERESLVIQDCYCPGTVSGFEPTWAEKLLRTVSATLFYTIPESGRPVCLIVHQAINEPNFLHNLISMMEMRLNYVVVNETPTFLCEVSTNFLHTVMVSRNHDGVLTIPIFIKGVMLCSTAQKPQYEFENCDHFDLTYDSTAYDPHRPSYALQEAEMTDANVHSNWGEVYDLPKPQQEENHE